ncbi:MAG: hypothetical protein GEU74_13350 [Nitriliruptorales bacterium]|nr:hypothetical protein [Nitriliruptorales bacterium]
MSTAPDFLPILARGAHRSPSDGACLMEYVSYLAGEPFSDQPRCTDTMLAAVARLVNDYMSDAARSRLAVLAPYPVAVRRNDPPLVSAVAAHCARAALRVDPDSRWLRRVIRAEERRRQRGGTGERPGAGRADPAGGQRPVVDSVDRAPPARVFRP